MTLKKVAKGDPLVIPADAWNAFVDAARDHQARRLGQTADGAAGAHHAGTVLVRNDSGAPRDRFDVLGIAGPVFDPTDEDQADQFAGQVVLVGVLVSSYLHEGQFAVLQEPVAEGALGRAVVCGLTVGRLFVDEGAENTRWATPAWNKPYLKASSTGTADVLWKEPGESEDEDDLKWAVLRLAPPARDIETEAVSSATVTGRWKRYGEPWTGTGFIEFVTAVPTGESGPVLYLQCTRDAQNAKIGFKDIQVGDVVGYARFEDRWAGVPGSDGKSYDGVVLVHAGTEGARLSGADEIDLVGGPGIEVDDEDGSKVSVDLATPLELPGLEFTDATDNGRLRVKANAEKAVVVSDKGVEVALHLDWAGLQYAADGGLAIRLATVSGLEIIDAGSHGALKAKLEPDGGLRFGSEENGLAVHLAEDSGLLCDGDGLRVFVGDGLDVTEGGALFVSAHDGVWVDAEGMLAARLAEDGGLELEAEEGLPSALRLVVAGPAAPLALGPADPTSENADAGTWDRTTPGQDGVVLRVSMREVSQPGGPVYAFDRLWCFDRWGRLAWVQSENRRVVDETTPHQPCNP